MADNTVLDAMSGGSTVATDNIGDVQYQRMKITIGNDGTAVGDVYDGRPLPTSVISGTTAITGGVSVSTPGTITSGSIAVTAGTIGTVAAVGQVHNAGTIQVLPDLPGGTVDYIATIESINAIQNGSIVVTAGTVTTTMGDLSGGTIDQLTTGSISNVAMIHAGTINVNTPGTITSGTIAINAGTVGGKAASGAASVANPIQIAGTDSGGTIYSPLINTAGAGTVSGVGTIPGVGVVSALTSGTVAVNTPGTITSGSIAVTAGTVGTVGAVGQVHNAGTIAGGTLGVVSNLTNGSIVVTAGTVGTVGNVAVVHNAGTIQAGTIQINTKPVKTVTTIGSVWGTTSGTAGTLVAAPGASTSIYINELSISNDGTSTLKAGLSFGTAQTGTAVVKMVGMAGNGGIQVNYPSAVGRHFSNTPLVMWTTGSGTASFNVSYWIEAT